MRLRWRTRTSMIAVAVVACILGVFVSVRHRAERFRLLAAYHREQYDELLSAIPFPGEEAYYAMTSSEFQQLPKRVAPPLQMAHADESEIHVCGSASLVAGVWRSPAPVRAVAETPNLALQRTRPSGLA